MAAAGLAAWGAVTVGSSTDTLGSWWPAAGLGVAALLLAPRERRVLVVAALLVVFTLGNLGAGRDLVTSAALGLSDTVETVVVVALLLRLTGGRLRRVADVVALVVAALAGAVVAGIGVSATYAVSLDATVTELLPVIALAHGVSVLALAPPAMVERLLPVAGAREVLVHGALTCVLVGLAVGGVLDGLTGLLVLALPIPLVVWAAARHELGPVLLLLVALAVAVTVAAATFPRGFAGAEYDELVTVQVSQVYLLVLVLIALPLALARQEREQALQQVRDSESTYRRAFTRSGLPVLLCTYAEGRLRIDVANREALELLGRPGQELRGQDLCDVLDAPELLALLASGPVDDFPGWSGAVPVPGAPLLHLEGYCSVVTASAGTPLLSLTMVDLSARHRLQRRLEAERTWTRAVMDTAASLIVVTDVEGTVISVNSATERLTGYAAHELVGRPLWETLIPEHLRHSVLDAVTNVLPVPPTGEMTVLTRAGESRTLEYAHAAFVEASSETGAPVTTLVFSATDVTEARESAGMVEHLLRSVTSLAFVGTDLRGAITMFSAGAERLLGLAPERARGLHLTSLVRVPPADGPDPGPAAEQPAAHPDFADLVRHVGPESSPSTTDWLMLPDGRDPVRVSMTCSAVRSDQGAVHAYLFVVRDVTETRRNQEILVNALRREREVVTRLQDLDRAKDDFISTVSHELRTPMSSIIGSAEMLADGVVGDLGTHQQQMVEVITRNGERLLDLADDLLTLAVFDRGGRSPRGDELDLRDVVTESVRTVRPPTGGRHLAWEVELPRQPVVVVGDPSHLERAVTNLLTNAVKFTPDGGRIEATLSTDPGLRTATVVVRDTGQGIAAGDLDHVFDRFYRSGEAQERAIQGSGLGLAIVKSIVESHEGRVAVRSVHGEGTAVTISIPLAREPRPPRVV